MYSIPIIPADLRHEETIIRAAHSLDCLQRTINSVFTRLDSRIAINNEKVKQCQNRIDNAKLKIKSLVGTKKAIKIVSPGRFPYVFTDMTMTFSGTSDSSLNKEDMVESYEVETRVEVPTLQNIQEKLIFFHVRNEETEVEEGGALSSEKRKVNECIGLGDMPNNLRSMRSLLLQTTDQCVYGSEIEKEYNRQKVLKQQKRSIQDVSQKQHPLDPAPYSLTNRNQKATPSGGLRYTPRLNEAPEIDLPMDLPDLPGIADNIHFEGHDKQNIAPSLHIEDLPELPELEETNTKTVPSVSIPQCTDESKIAEEKIEYSSTRIVIPPPPPPPPGIVTATSPYIKPDVEVGATSLPPISDSRSQLMDAIRNAGGLRRLRSAAAAPVDIEDRIQKDSKSTSTGGDLMADLHTKLMMRRKGISGTKEQNSNNVTLSGNPVISRLSALIPPPPSMALNDSQTQENETDDNEWAD